MPTPSLVDLDYDNIREELKSFMKNQIEFTDYDFDGSGLGVLLDVLAYNTQMNALMAHLTLNESFLNTSQVRSNVVSHAQLLGYVPRSGISASVELDVVVTGTSVSASALTIPRGTTFNGTINNVTYAFVVLSSVTANKSLTNTYSFTNIPVYEGTIRTERINVDGLVDFQKFELNSSAIDTTSIGVKVYDNATATIGDAYTKYVDIAESSSDSKVFFLQENVFGRYDVYFGDGRIGKKPANGSVVEVSYVETAGAAANNITSMSINGELDSISNIATTFSSGFTTTTGGASLESIESIKYNSPLVNATQDRAVSANDYKTLLLANFTELADVSVWGGEQASPPTYGKVFVTPSLVSGNLPTQSFKSAIISYLSTKNIGSILPEIVDPEYTYLQLFAGVKYDNNNTTKTAGELESLVRGIITTYNNTSLKAFGGVLRHSNLLSQIDNVDDGIVSSVIKPTMYKAFTPNPTQTTTYTILFPSKLYLASDTEFSIDSTEFLIDGISAKLGDEPITGSVTSRRVFFYNALTQSKLQSYSDVGTIDSTTGIITINSIKFDSTNAISVYVTPDAFDIAPKFNQLLQIIPSDVTVTMSLDSISTNGQSGVSNFETFTRL
jgi:hypothetical protein